MSRKELPPERSSTGVLYFGSRLRQIRNERKIPMIAAAEAVHVAPASLSRIETNSSMPSADVFDKLCGLYGIPREDLQDAPLHPRFDPKIRLGISGQGAVEDHVLPKEQIVSPAKPGRVHILFDVRIENIMDEYQLTEIERRLVRGAVEDLTRSLSGRVVVARTNNTNQDK